MIKIVSINCQHIHTNALHFLIFFKELVYCAMLIFAYCSC